MSEQKSEEMMEKLEKVGRKNWLFAIKTFYNVVGPTSWPNLTQEQKDEIENASDEVVRSICKELCEEALKRERYVSNYFDAALSVRDI